MSFDLDELELLKEIEKEYDLGFTPLPADMYHFVIGAASKVARQKKTNEPYLQLACTVLASATGEGDNRTHTEFGRWFGRQDVEAKTQSVAEEQVEKNNANAMRRTMGFWHNFAKAIANNPDSDGEVMGGILSTLRSLPKDGVFTEENFELIEAGFQNVLMFAEGIDFYARITRTMNRDDAKKIEAELIDPEDARWYTNIRPVDYDEGRAEVADQVGVGDL